MRLDPTYLNFISKEELRILTAIQIGMRNHQYVSADLIARIGTLISDIGNLSNGESFKTVRLLLKNKFIVHIGNKCDGYRLTYLGYDYLALHTFIKRGAIKEVREKIGVGKQSDVYKCITPQNQIIVLKLTRLGRNSFRSIKRNRQYIANRKSYNWLYLSRLSAQRQFLFMQILAHHCFPTPRPIDTNRHAILMSLVQGDTLSHVRRAQTQSQVQSLFEDSLRLVVRLAHHGLIHGDFNQFNLITGGEKVTVIDFPQCISSNHPNADDYFKRDVECIYKYFDTLAHKSPGLPIFDVSVYPTPILKEIVVHERLDHQIKKKGHITLQEEKEFLSFKQQEMGLELKQKEMSAVEQEEQGDYLDQDDQGEEEQLEEQNGQNQEKSVGEVQQNIQQFEKMFENNSPDLIYKGKDQGIQNSCQKQEIEGEIIQEESEEQKLQETQQIQDEQDIRQLLDDLKGEEWKGMTNYEIRQKIKEEKRVERQKRKKERGTSQYIKHALRRNQARKQMPRGNFGNKTKTKVSSAQIKQYL